MKEAVIKLEGFIATDTFTNRTNAHFADPEGKILCGAKCRFGYDCHTIIKFEQLEIFYTDSFRALRTDSNAKVLIKNHLPLEQSITCKTCRKKIAKILSS
jgi:hypothetical protein